MSKVVDVFIVTKNWTDDDGWPKSSPQIMDAFLDQEKAMAEAAKLDETHHGGRSFTRGVVVRTKLVT